MIIKISNIQVHDIINVANSWYIVSVLGSFYIILESDSHSRILQYYLTLFTSRPTSDPAGLLDTRLGLGVGTAIS